MVFLSDGVVQEAWGQEIIVQDDFEAGWGSWYSDNGIWDLGEPTVGPAAAHSGSNCMGTILDGNYPYGPDSRLNSGPIVLPDIADDEEIILVFWNVFSWSGADYGEIQVKIFDDGDWSDWTSLGKINSNSPVWSKTHVSLSEYSGKRIRVGFYHMDGHERAGTFRDKHYESTGWYLDDFKIIKQSIQFFDTEAIETFQFGLKQWYSDQGMWEVGQPTTGPESAFSGTECIGTVLDANYTYGSKSRLISPPILLPYVDAWDEILLRFRQFFSYSSADKGEVQVSIYENGLYSDWITEKIIRQYVADWHHASVDLSKYRGKEIRIGFYHEDNHERAGTFRDKHYESAGWYIDDVEIRIPSEGVIVYPMSMKIAEPEGSAIFKFRLTKQPTSDVNTTLSTSNPSECTFTPETITLTPENWSTGVPATVTAIDDDLVDGTQTCTIITSNAISEDPEFSDYNTADVQVTVEDDEVALTVESVFPSYTVQGQALPAIMIGTAFEGEPEITVYQTGGEEIPVSNVTVNSTTSIALTIPNTLESGAYNLKITADGQTYEMEEAITVAEVDIMANKKAIIVAGSGPYYGNALWNATLKCTKLAYQALITQGYSEDNIYYISPVTTMDANGDGANDVDADATIENLSEAINTWAHDADDLIVYMTGHGGNGYFSLNNTITPNEIVEAGDLNNWLNLLQETMPGKLIFIYDACLSGSFLSLLKPDAPLADAKQRIVITSSQYNRRAWFLDEGENSFSYQLWRYIYLVGKLYLAYDNAGLMMNAYQQPLIDTDGDGQSEDELTGEVIIGRGRVAASSPPAIGAVCDPQEVAMSGTANLWAKEVSAANGLSNVWAKIVPPTDEANATDPGLLTGAVRLKDFDEDQVYDADYSNFAKTGTYTVVIYAEDLSGYQSIPRTTRIQVLDAPQFTLADVIDGLKALTGLDIASIPSFETGADDTFGMEEVLYMLQYIAGLRQ
jgi:hypothetical protein